MDFGKIAVPIDHYAAQGNAVLGIRGSGKSYTATYVAERLLDASVPIVAFDPIGIWRFLRVPAAESKQGYKVVVAGGEHGDIPLPAHGAAEIMRAAMRDGVSIVFDLYDINLSKGDWRRVVESAIKVLLYENKAHGLRHIFLEEAAEFCPQRIQPDQGAVYSAIERLARMGGNAQLGYTLINQRAEEVNKAVLELCDLLILHRQKGRNSLTALSKWLDVAAVKGKIAEDVPRLENGECYIWPAGDAQPVKTAIPAKRTFHPDRRAMQKAVAAEAKRVDVSAFVETMRVSLEALTKEAEANDPKLLRAEIARLKRESERKPAPERIEVVDQEAVAEAEKRGYARGLADAISAVQRIPAPEVTPARQQPRALAAPSRPQPPPHQQYEGNSAVGAGGLRRMLIALAQRPQGMSRRQLGVRAGLSSSSGTFATYLGKMRSEGWINTSDPIRITDAGLAALGYYDPLPTGRDLLAYWLAELGNSGAARLLQALANAYPGGLSRDEAAAAADLSPGSGTFATYLGKLRTLELITGSGELRASEEFSE